MARARNLQFGIVANEFVIRMPQFLILILQHSDIFFHRPLEFPEITVDFAEITVDNFTVFNLDKEQTWIHLPNFFQALNIWENAADFPILLVSLWI